MNGKTIPLAILAVALPAAGLASLLSCEASATTPREGACALARELPRFSADAVAPHAPWPPGVAPASARSQDGAGRADQATTLRDSASTDADSPREAPPSLDPLARPRCGILRGTLAVPPEQLAWLPATFEAVLEVSDDAPPSDEAIDDDPPVRIERRDVWIGPDLNFELRDCPPGLYRLRLELPRPGENLVSSWTQTWLDPGDVREAVRVSFLEEPPRSLHGRVLDARGEPVPGATVVAGPHRVVCGPDGAYALRGLQIGPHTLRVSREGYAQATHPLDVLGEPLQHDVRLSLAP